MSEDCSNEVFQPWQLPAVCECRVALRDQFVLPLEQHGGGALHVAAVLSTKKSHADADLHAPASELGSQVGAISL